MAYAIRDTALFLDATLEEKKYLLKLRDLPQEKKPREKFLTYGSSVLSSAELLAIILNTGTTKEDVMAMSARVLREYGERTLVGDINPTALSKELGIPLIKALQIAACAELGKRFFKKNRGAGVSIRTARDVFEHVRDMRELSKEHLDRKSVV